MAHEALTPFFLPEPAAYATGGLITPLRNLMPRIGTPCPRPKDGGMCGCDEDDDDPPKVCLGRECDCV